MGTIRYLSALLIVITLPFAFTFWLIIHPLAPFWRRRGPALTYTVVGAIGVALAALVYRARSPLLAVEYGTSYPLATLGLLLIIGAMFIGRRRRRMLTWRILAGMPELSRAAGPGRLLKEGIYARIRHPRYVEAILGLCGYALIANYLASYAGVAIGVPVIYLIVLLEERELRARFGAEYADYCRDVPRFVPRFHPRPGGTQSG
jgi:protein-S-isoprenylcysteine O-methyltransferase Ste14